MRVGAIALVVALALAGCGSSGGSGGGSGGGTGGLTGATATASLTSTAPAGTSAPIDVTIKTLAFNPPTVVAKVGQTVRWTNLDGPLHNITHVGGPGFNTSPNLSTGQKFSLKLTTPGTIQYICSIHPFMKGTIVVKP